MAQVLNDCQVKVMLNWADGGNSNNINSVFQVAWVTRPLTSVSKICDATVAAIFDREKAIVRDEKRRIDCVFRRQGGLHVCRMKVEAPPLQRQGR